MIKLILTSALLRKALFLSLLGFAAIALIGPIIALVSTLLVFALIGLVTWPILRGIWGTMTRSKDKAEHPIPQPKPALREEQRSLAARLRDHRAWHWVGEQARFTGGVVLEVVCGALLGAMLGLLAGRESPDVEQYVGIGAVVGAFVGILVGKTGRADGVESKATS